MKQYMLYLTNCSNHNSLIEKDIDGYPFTKETAIDYAKNIRGNTVYLIEGKKTLIHGRAMAIETKYNIGQEVWVKTHSGNVYCNRITGIHIEQDGLIVYSLAHFADRTEDELFPTKEELLKSL